MAEQIHSCSVYCDRPECVREQRDAFRDWIIGEYGGYKLMAALIAGSMRKHEAAHPLPPDLDPEGEV